MFLKNLIILSALLISMSILASDKIPPLEKIDKKIVLQELLDQGWFKVISSDKAGDYYLNIKYIELIPRKVTEFSVNKSKWAESMNVWVKTIMTKADSENLIREGDYTMTLTNFNCDKKTIYIKYLSVFHINRSELNGSFNDSDLQNQEELVIPETINDELLHTSCFIKSLMIN